MFELIKNGVKPDLNQMDGLIGIVYIQTTVSVMLNDKL